MVDRLLVHQHVRQNSNVSNTARALSGISTAMVVTNAVVTIGTTLPPGKMRPPSAGGE